MAAVEASEALCGADTDTLVRQAAKAPTEIVLGHLRRYLDLSASGEAQAALAAASDACRAAPDLPEAHYAYGQAWLAADDPAQAERAFAEALKLRPAFPDAWVNWGLARYAQGHVADARFAMRQALRHDENHAAATTNLAVFLRISGDIDAAGEALDSAFERAPDNAGLRLNRAVELVSDERPDEALALLDEPIPADADARVAAHWRLQRSSVLLNLGRVAEAREAVAELEKQGPPPRDLRPMWLWRRVLLALAERDEAGATTAAELMDASIDAMGGEAVIEHAISARFHLAGFWSRRQDWPRVFGQWKAGHELLRKTQPFSRPRHLAFVEANLRWFDRERLHSGPRAANDDPTPLFIVGMPRSGTTLCEQILAAHGQVHGAGERVALNQAAWRLGLCSRDGDDESPRGVARLARCDAAQLDAAAARYLDELKALAPDKARIVDKMPGNYRLVGFLNLLLPGARIIHCVRDPRDIGLSIFSHHFIGVHAYAHDLGDLGWTLAQQLRLMQHWKAVSPSPILTVKLSDWVEDFEATLARVLAHVGLPHDDRCARFYENETKVRTASRHQVREPINARGLGRWRRFSAELEPLIAELSAAGALQDWDAPGANNIQA